jgi:hypothetical protein
MVRSYFYLKGISLWSQLSDHYHQLCNRVYDMYQHSCSYFQGDYHTWIFLKGHDLPLPRSHIKNNTNADVWEYTNHTLTNLEQPYDTSSKFSWLSAKLHIVDTYNKKEYEYDIDSFLHSFRVQTSVNTPPTLNTIFHTWCAENRLWFRSDCMVHFHVIDHNANEYLLTISSDNHSLEINNHRLQLRELTKRETLCDHFNPYTYYHG